MIVTLWQLHTFNISAKSLHSQHHCSLTYIMTPIFKSFSIYVDCVLYTLMNLHKSKTNKNKQFLTIQKHKNKHNKRNFKWIFFLDKKESQFCLGISLSRVSRWPHVSVYQFITSLAKWIHSGSLNSWKWVVPYLVRR